MISDFELTFKKGAFNNTPFFKNLISFLYFLINDDAHQLMVRPL